MVDERNRAGSSVSAGPALFVFSIQKEKTTCAKTRRAAEPVLKMPPARVEDRLKCGLPRVPFGPP